MIDVPLKVSLPLGKPYRVKSIASDLEHVGNQVAEGDLHPSMFWPRLAQIKARRERDRSRDFSELRERIRRDEYASEWVERWLLQQEFLTND